MSGDGKDLPDLVLDEGPPPVANTTATASGLPGASKLRASTPVVVSGDDDALEIELASDARPTTRPAAPVAATDTDPLAGSLEAAAPLAAKSPAKPQPAPGLAPSDPLGDEIFLDDPALTSAAAKPGPAARTAPPGPSGSQPVSARPVGRTSSPVIGTAVSPFRGGQPPVAAAPKTSGSDDLNVDDLLADIIPAKAATPRPLKPTSGVTKAPTPGVGMPAQPDLALEAKQATHEEGLGQSEVRAGQTGPSDAGAPNDPLEDMGVATALSQGADPADQNSLGIGDVPSDPSSGATGPATLTEIEVEGFPAEETFPEPVQAQGEIEVDAILAEDSPPLAPVGQDDAEDLPSGEAGIFEPQGELAPEASLADETEEDLFAQDESAPPQEAEEDLFAQDESAPAEADGADLEGLFDDEGLQAPEMTPESLTPAPDEEPAQAAVVAVDDPEQILEPQEEAPLLPYSSDEPPQVSDLDAAVVAGGPEALATLKKIAGPAADPERAAAALRAALAGKPYDPRDLPDSRHMALATARLLLALGICVEDLVETVCAVMRE